MSSPRTPAPAVPELYDRFVLDSLPLAVITVDPELRITGFNPWAERVTGYARAEAVGRPCGEILQGGRCRGQCPLRTILDRQHRTQRLETTIRTRDGRTIPVRMSTAGLFDDDGELLGGLEAFQDVSAAKQARREKDNLVSMFAHDLKSSVVVIGGFARRLLARVQQAGGEPARRPLEIIRSEADKLEALTDEFLEFARLQTGRLTLNPSATSLDKELSELVDAYRVRAEGARVRVVLETDPSLPIIQADAARLRRVFANLLDNALKYSEPGSTVIVRVDDRGEAVTVQVQDHGCGIDAGELPFLFDPFHRAADAGGRDGFGLGLATVKAIVDAHGGRVTVESEPGQGSTFTVELPKAGPEGAGPPAGDPGGTAG